MDIESIFEKSFDFETYIEKRLLDISDETERSFAREFVMDGLVRIFRESEANYRRLEERVFSEVSSESSKFGVYLTVVSREKYDITNGVWFPVAPDDHRAERTPRTVFLAADMELCSRVAADSGRDFTGRVTTEAGEIPVTFKLVQSERYKFAVEHLYELFQRNGVSWTTLNCGYLLKFFDVVVSGFEGEILEFEGDFGELSGLVRGDMMPLWNIRKIFYDSQKFVVPTVDAKYYEHEFPAEKFGIENGFLLELGQDTVSVRRTAEKIFVVTPDETISQNAAFSVMRNQGKPPHYFEYPLLGNGVKDSFTGRLIESGSLFLQTRAELIRRVEQYDVLGAVRLRNVRLQNAGSAADFDEYLTVMNVAPVSDGSRFLKLRNLNWFIIDELVNRDEQKILVLSFAVRDRGNILNLDLISFILSQLQRSFAEYRLEAVIEGDAG